MLTPSTEVREIPNTEVNLDLQIHKLYNTWNFNQQNPSDLHEKNKKMQVCRNIWLAASLFTLFTLATA